MNDRTVLRYGRDRWANALGPDGTSAQTDPLVARFNAAFFSVMDPYLDRHLRAYKGQLFRDVPGEVVEIGAGTGANFRYYTPGTRVIAVEPNVAMHAALRRRARSCGIELEIRPSGAEQIALDDGSAQAVVSTLVLCTVRDPERVLREVQRVLAPGGRYFFLEHVAARDGTVTRIAQRVVRRPWAWVFEGCSCERRLEQVIGRNGFTDVILERHRLRTPFLPFNTQISGVATK